MNCRILATLGPSSLRQDIISQIENEYLYLFRINLSHTPIDSLADIIRKIQSYTEIPICLDSEGAQIRNQSVTNGKIFLHKDDVIKIHFNETLGNSKNLSFTPNIAEQLSVGDEMSVDFNSTRIKIIEKHMKYCMAKVEHGGKVGSNKAVTLNREIDMEAITSKDKKAITIAKGMGIKYFALSFAGSSEDVKTMRKLAGRDATIISKIESKKGVLNLNDIIDASDEILIDRGDLSREINLEKIPFLQRRIIAMARSKKVPVYVATNLLESMVKVPEPTRAEINDVVSTLLMGANGLVLASETAIGKYPVKAAKMIKKLISQTEKWTSNTSITELLES